MNGKSFTKTTKQTDKTKLRDEEWNLPDDWKTFEMPDDWELPDDWKTLELPGDWKINNKTQK